MSGCHCWPRAGQRVNPGPLDGQPYQWWYAFNQLRGLPERLLSGRSRYLIDWLLDYGDVGLVEDSGHHIAEEQPETVIAHLTDFFG